MEIGGGLLGLTSYLAEQASGLLTKDGDRMRGLCGGAAAPLETGLAAQGHWPAGLDVLCRAGDRGAGHTLRGVGGLRLR